MLWLNDRLRGSRLYGPYHHGGRHYLQLMIRGQALRSQARPHACRAYPGKRLDDHSHARFAAMLERYRDTRRRRFTGQFAVKLRPIDERLRGRSAGGSLYAVGGRVRDEIRRRSRMSSAADSDYVVAGVAARRASSSGSRSSGGSTVVGAAFAVLKLTSDGQTVDVALPRRERSTGHGHRDFEVQSGPDVPLEDDLARRDFRMNMIARALPAGDLVDPYGGEADIRARRIDILTPRSVRRRSAAHAARRAVRRALRVRADAATRAAMTAAAPLVATVSPERVADELTKLFVRARAAVDRPRAAARNRRSRAYLAGAARGRRRRAERVARLRRLASRLATLDATPPGDALLRLAALLHDVGKPRTKDGPHFYRHEIVGAEMARAMLERFRFSNEVVDASKRLVRQHMYAADPEMNDAAVRRFIRRIGAGESRAPVRVAACRHRRLRLAQARRPQRAFSPPRLRRNRAQAGVFGRGSCTSAATT